MNKTDKILGKLGYFEKLVARVEELLMPTAEKYKGNKKQKDAVEQTGTEEMLLPYVVNCMYEYSKKFERSLNKYKGQGGIVDKQLEERITNVGVKSTCYAGKFRCLLGSMTIIKEEKKRKDSEQQAFEYMIGKKFDVYSNTITTAYNLLQNSGPVTDGVRIKIDKLISDMDKQAYDANWWIKQYNNWMIKNKIEHKAENLICIKTRQEMLNLQATEVRAIYQNSLDVANTPVLCPETKSQTIIEGQNQQSLLSIPDGIYVFKEGCNTWRVWFLEQRSK